MTTKIKIGIVGSRGYTNKKKVKDLVFEIKETVKMYSFDLLDMKFDHPNMKFIKKDFLTYDYSKIPHKFDLILCLEVLEHIENFKKTLQQITTLLKPKGTLVLSTINRNLFF